MPPKEGGKTAKDYSIECLNDDFLVHIFNLLPLVDRYKIERVCRRWKIVARNSWTQVKKLELEIGEVGFKPVGFKHAIKLLDKSKIKVLKCRKFLYVEDLD